MSSVPPPPMGPGGHPRYSQHMERDRPYGGPPPPPSYGNSYSSYPPQPPYGGNYGQMQGQPPGYPPRAPGYPPHSSYGPSGYGAAGGFPPQSVHHPPYYGGGYEQGHYGGQPPPPSHPPQSSYPRGASPPPPPGSAGMRGPNGIIPTAPPSAEPKKVRSPPQKSPEKNSTQQQSTSETLPDHGEVERLRAAAATELTTEEVKPIQTDFHFFAKEHIEKYRKQAEEEVKSNNNSSGGDDLDPLLVNSNLNTRLMKAWEDLTKEDRDAYMIKEEADRRRFMEDDEIASRHCATLTARGKSPRVAGSSSNGNGNSDSKVKKEETTKSFEIKKEGETTTIVLPAATPKEEPKRPVPEASGETQESPTKKSKAAAAAATV